MPPQEQPPLTPTVSEPRKRIHLWIVINIILAILCATALTVWHFGFFQNQPLSNDLINTATNTQCEQIGTRVAEDLLKIDYDSQSTSSSISAVQNHFNSKQQACFAAITIHSCDYGCGGVTHLVNTTAYTSFVANPSPTTTIPEIAFCGFKDDAANTSTDCTNNYEQLYGIGTITKTQFNELVNQYLSQ